MRVAYLTSSSLLRRGHEATESREHQLQREVLSPACRSLGLELCEVAWSDPIDAVSFDAFVIGTPWDYPQRAAEFLSTIQRLAAIRPLFNPAPWIEWNVDKSYLRDLESKGIEIVPTVWVDAADSTTVTAALDQARQHPGFALSVGTGAESELPLVLKPRVGASSWRQVLIAPGAELPPAKQRPPQGALLQPYIPSIETEGEISFIFIDGSPSHAVRKCPAPNDYRIQGAFGGVELPYEPSAAEWEQMANVLRHLPSEVPRRYDGSNFARESTQDEVREESLPPLYARVDAVWHQQRLLLMELELIEPYLYPDHGDHFGERFAQALVRRLDRDTTT